VPVFVQDLSFAQTAAANSSTPIPLGSVAHQMYRIMCNTGYARKDFSSVFQFLQQEHKDEKK
jgi:3-hydroxyisobutyrate dehydrogenase